jgi:D-2-hydroxyacid dehydrogenase (NADP+)
MPVTVLATYDASQQDLARIHAVSDSLIVQKAPVLEEAVAKAAEAEVIYAGRWSEKLWKSAPRLKWVQCWAAGVERFLTPEFIASPVILTNAKGIYAVPIAEHVMAFVLYFSRSFHHLVQAQLYRRWDWRQADELSGKTLGIIGLGGIGSEVARRAKGLDMRVVAVRRRPELHCEHADEIRGPDGLPWLLSESDFVALCAAATLETRHLIGEKQLRLMKPTAYLINIGRGALVNERALVSALDEKRIAGAGLDVFEQEPLPAESPLWTLPNVLITPHIAGSSPRSHERVVELFCENLRRYLEGTELLNVVDKEAGY